MADVNGDLPNGEFAMDSVNDENIRDTDIVFDCPHCGHGLVIDNRGAGLVITCAECGKPVQVPIPEGMDISDLDQGPEGLQLQIRTLRNALLKAENRERELQKLVSGISERKATLERARMNQLRRITEMHAAVERVQKQLSESANILNRLTELLREELKQP